MTAGHEERSVELQHVFRFMIFDSVSKLYRLRYDWCRKLKVNFALLTPSVKIKGRVCEMSTLPVQLSPETKVWFTFDGAPFGCLRDKRCRGGSKGAIGAAPPVKILPPLCLPQWSLWWNIIFHLLGVVHYGNIGSCLPQMQLWPPHWPHKM